MTGVEATGGAAAFDGGIPSRPSPLLCKMGEQCAEDPGKAMVATPEGKVTYREAYELALSLISVFHFEFRLDAGSSVLLYLPNVAEVPSLIAAAQSLGCSLAFRAPSLIEYSLQNDVALLRPNLVIVLDADSAAAAESTNVPILSLRGSMGRSVSLEVARARVPAVDPGSVIPHSQLDPEILLFSSGTTGTPKAIANRMSSFTSNAFELTAALEISSRDVLYVPVPFFHVYGFIGMVSAILRKATLSIVGKYTVERSRTLVDKAGVTVYFGVPTMFVREMNADTLRENPLKTLRLCMMAGAECSPATFERCEEYFGCPIVQSYGMTETAATLTVEKPESNEEVRKNGLGFPIAGVSLSIDDNSGEVLVKTPALMTRAISGEYRESEIVDEDGWFHTGDIGFLDEEGRLHVTDRLKDLIVRGGLNVYPSQVERVFRDLAGVSECFAVGYPDAELGERVCLLVVPDGRASITVEELRSFSKGKLEKGQYPDAIVYLEEAPCLPNGKPDKKAMREIAKQAAGL